MIFRTISAVNCPNLDTLSVDHLALHPDGIVQIEGHLLPGNGIIVDWNMDEDTQALLKGLEVLLFSYIGVNSRVRIHARFIHDYWAQALQDERRRFPPYGALYLYHQDQQSFGLVERVIVRRGHFLSQTTNSHVFAINLLNGHINNNDNPARDNSTILENSVIIRWETNRYRSCVRLFVETIPIRSILIPSSILSFEPTIMDQPAHKSLF